MKLKMHITQVNEQTCSGRTLRGASKMELECSHECTVASVSQWGDDQSTSVAKIFVPIRDIRGDHSHNDCFVLKVVSELRDPLEVIGSVYLSLIHI